MFRIKFNRDISKKKLFPVFLKYFFLLYLLILNPFYQLNAFANSACLPLFNQNSSQQSLDLWNQVFDKERYIRQDQLPTLDLKNNGCGLACAWNLYETVRLQKKMPSVSFKERDSLISEITSQFPTLPTTGLNIANLSRLMEFLVSKGKLSHQVSAFQDKAHPFDQRSVGKTEFSEKDLFAVNQGTFKILLVEINRLGAPDESSYLYSHFYNVVGFKNGIVTLSDPNNPRFLIDFNVTPYKDWQTGLMTFELKPIKKYSGLSGYHGSHYSHVNYNVRYSINGYVVVQ